MIGIIEIVAILAVIIVIVAALSWYKIVPPSEAHLVVTPTEKFVVSPDDSVNTKGKRSYFAISGWIPFIGRSIRVLDVTIKEIRGQQETYEKDQARYIVKTSTKYRISNIEVAAEKYISETELEEQLKEVIQAAVREVTIKYDVVNARAKKQLMDEEIKKSMGKDFEIWGVELVNFQLVDFQDTDESTIISDISKRREVEISAETREMNAEKKKQARIKEAEAEEKAREREIAKEKVIGEKEQNKLQAISEQQKLAKEKEFAVIRVQTIKQAEIDKEKKIVEANMAKEKEEIMKEQKLLEGQGDKLKQEEQAKGTAAPIREMGLAEAEAKEKLQAALNKFSDAAIRALIAEKVVEMQETVGVETAKALAGADLKVFAGGDGAGSDGFNLGKLISAMSVSNEGTADATLNKIARPNDLGLSALGLKAIQEKIEKSTEKDKTKKSIKKDEKVSKNKPDNYMDLSKEVDKTKKRNN